MAELTVKRIEEVINTTATECSEADFMLTHMPFNALVNYIKPMDETTKHLFIDDDLYVNADVFGENSVLDDLMSDMDAHQFVMIQGKNGCGKSHLVRWLYYEFRKSTDKNIEKCIFIPRSKNTLKATIKTILDENILPTERNEYYNNLISSGVSDLSEIEFRETVFSNLKIIIKNDEKSAIDKILRLRLFKYLSDSVIEELFMDADGPIEKLCDKINGKLILDEGEEIFEEDNISFPMKEIQPKLASAVHTADMDVIQFARDIAGSNKIQNEVCQYLNSLVEIVIKRTLPFSGSDLREVFDEIRRELKRNGQKLSLFIEDINIFTGIDSEIIEVLIEDHKSNSDLCRILSVIGSTDAFFDRFHTSLQERLTRNIVILEKSLLKKEEWIIEFAAKYINAINLSSNDSELWYNNKDNEFPIWKCSYSFSDVIVNNKKMSIFPFNRNALINLYNLLPENSKSPRCFLKDVIKHIELKWITYQKKIIDEERNFYNASIASLGRLSTNDEVANEVCEPVSESKKRAVLLKIWGNRNFKLDEDGLFGGIDQEIYTFFEIHDFYNTKISGKRAEPDKKEVEVSNKENKTDTDPIIKKAIKSAEEKENDALNEKIEIIRKWAIGDQEEFKIHRDARKLVCDFILNNINWELENFSYDLAKSVFVELSSVYIEGQSVSGEGIIRIPRNDESEKLLRALFIQKTYGDGKGWDFPGGPDQQIFAFSWLGKNKENIVKLVKNAVFGQVDVDYIVVKAALVYLLYKGKITSFDTDSLMRVLFEHGSLAISSLKDENSRWISIEKQLDRYSTSVFELMRMRFQTVIGETDVNNCKYCYLDAQRLLVQISKAVTEGITKKPEMVSAIPQDERIAGAIKLLDIFFKNFSQIQREEIDYVHKKMESIHGWIGGDISEKMIDAVSDKAYGYQRFIKDDCNIPFSSQPFKILDENMFAKKLSVAIEIMEAAAKEKNADEQLGIMSHIDENLINKACMAYEALETLIAQCNSIFDGGIDRSMVSKETNIKNNIKIMLSNVNDL